ncbi:MAG: ribosomal-processing cysteine protease Prp [Spirochaetia bacterium]|nr:ribosomal-processing cysteine protease Prp [Spirochaetia bacterium]
MINIEVKKSKEFYIYLRVEGHAPNEFGKPGENIFCAAVSALTQTLLLCVSKRNIVEILKNQKGILEYNITKPDMQSNIEFEFMLIGLENLKKQNIKYISIKNRS